jgi:hypothetical protein
MATAPTPYLQPGDKVVASGERNWVTGKAPERRRDVLLDPPLELDSSQNKQVRSCVVATDAPASLLVASLELAPPTRLLLTFLMLPSRPSPAAPHRSSTLSSSSAAT